MENLKDILDESQIGQAMPFLKNLKDKAEEAAKKGVEVGKDAGAKGVDLGKKGVDKTKDAVKGKDN